MDGRSLTRREDGEKRVRQMYKSGSFLAQCLSKNNMEDFDRSEERRVGKECLL